MQNGLDGLDCDDRNISWKCGFDVLIATLQYMTIKGGEVVSVDNS